MKFRHKNELHVQGFWYLETVTGHDSKCCGAISALAVRPVGAVIPRRSLEDEGGMFRPLLRRWNVYVYYYNRIGKRSREIGSIRRGTHCKNGVVKDVGLEIPGSTDRISLLTHSRRGEFRWTYWKGLILAWRRIGCAIYLCLYRPTLWNCAACGWSRAYGLRLEAQSRDSVKNPRAERHGDHVDRSQAVRFGEN